MYTVQYLFRRHPLSPNRVSTSAYLLFSLLNCTFSAIVFSAINTFVGGVLTGLALLCISVPYWFSMNIWRIEDRMNMAIEPYGLELYSMYSLESAADCDNVFIDAPTSSVSFNNSAILLSPLSMDSLEPLCTESGMGEFFCNVDNPLSQNIVKRRVAKGKTVAVAYDIYPTAGPLEDADCVLIPFGTDTLGSPAAVSYDQVLYGSAAEACRTYVRLSRQLMGQISMFYTRLALTACLIQFLAAQLCILFAGLLPSLVVCGLGTAITICLGFLYARAMEKSIDCK